ncbi:MAG: hypothetical protein ACRDC3_14700 [Paraclostridium dentum]|uniref:Uncharacterized protein n=1 Tax=Paraclostridium bifermentans TaxID=1490 RepID=A0A5P3XD74_PARBF|nr:MULTISPECIES: hypothetical protein [Paraclostridium]MBZ6004930.1 hypothetical protein [Paraclostridium bifermentans]MCU9808061.1 hypothetical protein [Paraclostridium sp. AKS46]MDU0295763.1 hypothetical protein [Paraclostridium sp. MRS3W1]QEZ68380.1 hypothetical protein D4A35_05280 [Paraclostridium bifermentans]
MLNTLAKNQYVKISNCNKNEDVEYGVVVNKNEDNYDIMSIGFENKNGNFLEYPPNVDKLVQSYSISDADFEEVKKNEIRRKMNIWLESHCK